MSKHTKVPWEHDRLVEALEMALDLSHDPEVEKILLLALAAIKED